ncbi:MAG: SAM-dependent methyltransferase [Spirochaetales bacterium]|nr:SAM-dependent methyltransferase [Spirochaetales bacterium]
MENRINEATSMTAAMTCSIRAASFYEKDSCLKSDDFVAPLLLPRIMQPMVRSGLIRRTFMRFLAPKGIYEYVIARTKYIDGALQASLNDGVRQVVFFGAGYDTRAIRFHESGRGTIFYELDSPLTQEAKIGQFRKRGIVAPPTCRFIPIDFNRESPQEKLRAAGFHPEEKSLFILEGVLMYLGVEAVEETLRIMRELMSPGSRAVCDFIYRSVLRRENLYYGEEGIYKRVNKYGEAWKFGIEKCDMTSFFPARGFRVVEIADAALLEDRFLKGEKRHRMNGTHCIAMLEG